MLSIQAKMDRKADDGSRFYQEIARDYLLPDTLKIDELKSILTDDGVRPLKCFSIELRMNSLPVFFVV